MKQKLFDTINRITGHDCLESEIFEIIDVVKKNNTVSYDKLPFKQKEGRGKFGIFDNKGKYVFECHNQRDMDFIIMACNSFI